MATFGEGSKLPPHPNVVGVYGAILSGGKDQGIILELCSEVCAHYSFARACIPGVCVCVSARGWDVPLLSASGHRGRCRHFCVKTTSA